MFQGILDWVSINGIFASLISSFIQWIVLIVLYLFARWRGLQVNQLEGQNRQIIDVISALWASTNPLPFEAREKFKGVIRKVGVDIATVGVGAFSSKHATASKELLSSFERDFGSRMNDAQRKAFDGFRASFMNFLGDASNPETKRAGSGLQRAFESLKTAWATAFNEMFLNGPLTEDEKRQLEKLQILKGQINLGGFSWLFGTTQIGSAKALDF